MKRVEVEVDLQQRVRRQPQLQRSTHNENKLFRLSGFDSCTSDTSKPRISIGILKFPLSRRSVFRLRFMAGELRFCSDINRAVAWREVKRRLDVVLLIYCLLNRRNGFGCANGRGLIIR